MRRLAFFLLGLLFPVLLGFLCSGSAHAQTVCTLDASNTVAQLFGMPTQEVLAQAFSIGLFTPLTGYLVAYFVGLLVNLWNS